MAEIIRSTSAPLTEDAFIVDKQRFWGSFTSFIFGNAAVIVVILILMAIFLV